MTSNSHQTSRVEQCRVIELPRHGSEDGSIAVAENSSLLPFAIKRTFFIYDIPSDAVRGGHSHHTMEELIVAASGSFMVKLYDGVEWKFVTLNRPYQALYVPAGIWRSLEDFSTGSVCLSFCPDKFDEADYVRDIDLFKKLTGGKV